MTPMDKKKLRILVVEDHQDTLNLYRQLLESDGHSVAAAESFGGALALADQHRFDVLIADVTLPDGSGWALLERLRALMPALRGIAVTGHAQPRDIDRSERAGCCVHLSKPIKLEQVGGAIRRCAPAAENS